MLAGLQISATCFPFAASCAVGVTSGLGPGCQEHNSVVRS
jgi:hypothetical protein